jgi:hypothetical protein
VGSGEWGSGGVEDSEELKNSKYPAIIFIGYKTQNGEQGIANCQGIVDDIKKNLYPQIQHVRQNTPIITWFNYWRNFNNCRSPCIF